MLGDSFFELVFETKGEVNKERIKELINPYAKNLRKFVLAFIGLLEKPTSNPDERKREYHPALTV